MGTRTAREAVTPGKPNAEDAEPLELRTQRCLAGIISAWRDLAEVSEQLIALHRDPWADRGAFLARATALTESVHRALDEASAVVGGVPTVVDQEVHARLQKTTSECLLLQVAMLAEVPQA
jgi:hypothetical protein